MSLLYQFLATHECHSQRKIRVDAKAPDGQMMMVMIHTVGI